MKENYKTDLKFHDENKKIVNDMLCSCYKGDKKVAVVLDTEKLLTTNTLVKKLKWSPNKIEIVNCVEDTATKIERKHKQVCNMYLGEYLDFIDIPDNKNSISLVFFDYCCSLFGNTTMNPREDIKRLFSSCLLSSYALLGFTFAYRSGKKQETPFWTINNLDMLITDLAYKSKMYARKVGYHTYNGMIFQIWEIQK